MDISYDEQCIEVHLYSIIFLEKFTVTSSLSSKGLHLWGYLLISVITQIFYTHA